MADSLHRDLIRRHKINPEDVGLKDRLLNSFLYQAGEMSSDLIGVPYRAKGATPTACSPDPEDESYYCTPEKYEEYDSEAWDFSSTPACPTGRWPAKLTTLFYYTEGMTIDEMVAAAGVEARKIDAVVVITSDLYDVLFPGRDEFPAYIISSVVIGIMISQAVAIHSIPTFQRT